MHYYNTEERNGQDFPEAEDNPNGSLFPEMGYACRPANP